MGKVIILGNLPGQYHLYDKFYKKGHEVISVIRKGEVPYSKKYKYLEEVTDFYNIYEIEKIINRYKNINSITSITLEKLIVPLATICKKFKFPGIQLESAIIGTNKSLMIKEFKKNNILFPKSITISKFDKTIKEKLQYFNLPLIIKPTDNSAKRGVYKVFSIDELENKVKKSLSYSVEKKIVIQEFIDGKEIIASTFIDGNNFLVNIIDKITTKNFVEIYFTAPTFLKDYQIKKVNKNAHKVIKALKIKKGFAHTEMIIKNDILYVIETSPRVSIGTIAMSKYHYGFDESEFTMKFSLNEKLFFKKNVSNNRVSLMHFMPKIGRILKKSKINNVKLNNIKELVFFKDDGYIVKEFISNVDRIGFVVFENCLDTTLENEIKDRLYLEEILFK